jgi:hypothetical protein
VGADQRDVAVNLTAIAAGRDHRPRLFVVALVVELVFLVLGPAQEAARHP